MADIIIDKIKYNNQIYKFQDNVSGYTTNIGTITGITTSSPLSGSGTSGSIALSHATSGVTAKTTSAVYPFTVNDTGHVTSVGDPINMASTTFDITYDSDTGDDADTVDSAGKAIFNFTNGTSHALDEVTQEAASTSYSGQHKLLASLTSGSNSNVTLTESVIKTPNITIQPSTSSLRLYKIGDTTTYLRLQPESIYLHNGSDSATLNISELKKLEKYGKVYKFNQYTAYTSAITASTWFKFTNFTLSAGTYLIICSARFVSTSTEGTRIFRLSTTNALSDTVTSPARASTFSEVTMKTHSNSQNYMNFSIILSPTASTTYYLWGWSSVAASEHASNNSCNYSYFQLL